MGQTKSKSWRRLSESDCVHLLNDDDLNRHNNNILIKPTPLSPSSSNNHGNQEFKYHTITTNGRKWSPSNNSNINKHHNLNENCGNIRNRSSSINSSSEATLLKFQKFDSTDFPSNNGTKNQYNKNLYESDKNGSLIRKSLPPCPSKLSTVSSTMVPSSTSASTTATVAPIRSQLRFYPSLLEPEILLNSNKGNLESENLIDTSDLIESPPPLSDSTIPFKVSNVRPVTMYQFEPFISKSNSASSSFNRRASVARGLSFTELLEQCNTFDQCTEELSDQTLVNTGDNERDDSRSHESIKTGNKCLIENIVNSNDETGSNVGMLDPTTPRVVSNSVAIRCSGLDCICDRCIQHRFKLLNWLLPNCTRINAERLLHGRMEGTFLVRKSEKFPGQYTLSFVCRRTVRHCFIMRSVYGMMFIPIYDDNDLFILYVLIGFGLRWSYSFETLHK